MNPTSRLGLRTINRERVWAALLAALEGHQSFDRSEPQHAPDDPPNEASQPNTLAED